MKPVRVRSYIMSEYDFGSVLLIELTCWCIVENQTKDAIFLSHNQ